MLAIREYEDAHGIPSGYINHAIAHTPNCALHKLERGEMSVSKDFFTAFTVNLSSLAPWESFHASRNLPLPPGEVPRIDGERLFWDMLRKSRAPDPYFTAAIAGLRATGRYKLAAVTNDYRFPAHSEHPYADTTALRAQFDEFVSSSECGMRKPERGIYQLALARLGVRDPGQVVFLDDIGANCKVARELGMRTIKVTLEDTWRAVRELEDITKERLLPDGEPPVIGAGKSSRL
jgi:HAD superfamily hydrolase (TIGR01509 family)